LVFLLVSIVAFGTIPQATWAGESLRAFKLNNPSFTTTTDPENAWDTEGDINANDYVYIFYTPTQGNMTYVAQSVQEVLGYRLPHVFLIPVYTLADIEDKLNENPWAAVYALDADLTGLLLPSEHAQWDAFYELLARYRQCQHIIGTSNTFSMSRVMPVSKENIHLAETEQTDPLLLIMYDIWAISEMALQRAQYDLTFEPIAADLQAIALEIYSNNFDALFQAQMEPHNPIGSIDPVALEERTTEMFDRHAPTSRPAAFTKDENGTLTEVPLDDLPDDFSPTIKLSAASALEEGDFALSEIPMLSGLRGPIGEIIDLLLKVLEEAGETVFSIPTSVMGDIMEAFNVVQSVVGIVSDFDSESALKTLLDVLGNQFPFMEDLKPYVRHD